MESSRKKITPGYSFRVYGNQSWGIAKYDDYSGTSWKKYTIPVGSFFTGSFNRLVFMGDDDMYNRQTSYFRNVKVYEGSCNGSRTAVERTDSPTTTETEVAQQGFGINIFPNPAKDVLNLELMGTKTATATLYGITGMRVWSGKRKLKSRFIRAAGIYTLRVIGEGGRATNHKFIKQ